MKGAAMGLRLEDTAEEGTSLAWNSDKRIAGMVIELTGDTWMFISARDRPFIGTNLDEGLAELERVDGAGE
ncbi:hypothetical protein [Nocardia sp. NPDC127526]|uniref:hypothetical protein n=1 Tax=Nocardia sp. NPDC127526 TaxID=3345393 RepID=UPI00363CB86B